MESSHIDPALLLSRALESGRIHSAYLISGPPERTHEEALRFARSLVCSGDTPPCESCKDCGRSRPPEEPVTIDGQGKHGPLYRHIGDHPDLLWTERDPDSTRVRIAQVRALQNALRLGANEGGWRVAVVADAELLNAEAQNALLRLLEEPPNKTCIVLVAASASGLLATIRSRCQRVRLAPERGPSPRDSDAPPETRELILRLDEIGGANLPTLLDWAEEYRGNRALAAEKVQYLLEAGSEWLRERAVAAAGEGQRSLRGELDAYRVLSACRRDLVQRNANPQMVAERALFAVRRAVVT
jgi:hypothetical protein